MALFFLGALPSTVSSSVVMVSLARGNVPTAIFNASISGLIGIVVTPLWMGLFLSGSDELQFGNIVFKFFVQIILPLLIGLILQPSFGERARKYNRELGLFDKCIIILIVYTSFSNSFTSGLFSFLDPEELLKLFLLVLLMFVIVFFRDRMDKQVSPVLKGGSNRSPVLRNQEILGPRICYGESYFRE